MTARVGFETDLGNVSCSSMFPDSHQLLSKGRGVQVLIKLDRLCFLGRNSPDIAVISRSGFRSMLSMVPTPSRPA